MNGKIQLLYTVVWLNTKKNKSGILSAQRPPQTPWRTSGWVIYFIRAAQDLDHRERRLHPLPQDKTTIPTEAR